MAASEASGQAEPNHALRIAVPWFILSVIADVLIWFVWYPHLPPGRMTDIARGQQFDIAVMAVLCAPVLVFIWVYFAYALVTWRRRPDDDEDGPAIHGTARIQATWIIVTAVIVLFLAGFGTYELIVPNGAGGGEGPSPIWNPPGVTTASATKVIPPAWSPGSSQPLVVQAIGQQWEWTYRYPQYGGMETTDLVLPVNSEVIFHVTSLDVIHSFWAYKLGVKADANPGVDNVAYAKPDQTGTFTVRCNELCGIWHGAMFDNGQVVSPSQFQSWASGLQGREQSSHLLAALPPYAFTYDPTVVKQLGKDLTNPNINGITGANGYYYPGPQAGTPGDPVSP
ncbi:MAG TPA: cytochrome c oxidase subunit II [Streptosporangiaceae bacterium]|jgi:cytochrome c oxidase subunit 2|nr:cytochrome c oxidase subunit II [Streptosporangiaceae bacterium]